MSTRRPSRRASLAVTIMQDLGHERAFSLRGGMLAWEAAGFTNAVSIGLAVSAIGFFFALFVGIPIVNWGIRKGLTTIGRGELPDYFRRGIYTEDQINEPTGMMTTHSGNVDSLAFQGGAVGICYLLTYLAYYGIEQIIGTLSPATWDFSSFTAC